MREVFRISTSGDDVNESWFAFPLLLPCSHPQDSGRNAKTATSELQEGLGKVAHEDLRLFLRRVSENMKDLQTAFAEEGHSFVFLNRKWVVYRETSI